MNEALEFDLVLCPAAVVPTGHTLGDRLRVGCHLSPPGMPLALPVVVYHEPSQQFLN
jgi:hypothetical protein